MMRYDWTVTIGGVDVSALVKAAGTIDYGKPSALAGFSAPIAEFDMFTEEGFPQWASAWPVIDMGMPVLIHVTWDGTTQWRRFTGEVTAIEHGAYQRSITAAGTITKYDYHWAGATSRWAPRSAEQDASRVAWLAIDADDPPLVVEAAGARWLREIPAGSTNDPLLDHLLRIADDCDGMLMQDRLGVVRYRTRNFTTPPTVLIPEFITERETLNLVKELTGVCNSVYVHFGEPNPNDSDKRPTVYHAMYSGGVDGWGGIGERIEEIDTNLIWQTDAEGKAIQYLDQRQQDWQLNDVTLLMNLATGPVADDVLDLQIGWPVTIATLPPGAPMAEYDGQIIGTTEVMHQTDYRFILHLAPFVNAAEEVNQDPIYPDGIITGYDSTGVVAGAGVDIGKSWRWCKWTATGSGHSITNGHDDQVWARILAVAGGGGGGNGGGPGGMYATGGGGGAGGLINLSILIGIGTQPVTIGAGGAAAGQGQDTYALGATLYGGGAGGGGGGSSNGGDGGSGGGYAHNRADHSIYGAGGEGVDGQGWPGNAGGGGAAGAGAGPGGGGGPGVSLNLTGAAFPTVYAQGGGTQPDPGTGAGPVNTGQGGAGGWSIASAQPGGSGIFIVRYRIA